MGQYDYAVWSTNSVKDHARSILEELEQWVKQEGLYTDSVSVDIRSNAPWLLVDGTRVLSTQEITKKVGPGKLQYSGRVRVTLHYSEKAKYSDKSRRKSFGEAAKTGKLNMAGLKEWMRKVLEEQNKKSAHNKALWAKRDQLRDRIQKRFGYKGHRGEVDVPGARAFSVVGVVSRETLLAGYGFDFVIPEEAFDEMVDAVIAVCAKYADESE
jgi:hypothetical protein